MYLDFLQNRPGATIAGPYSLRPKLGATVSMPLHWEEVKKGLAMTDFNIKNAVARVRSVGDLFKGTLADGIDMDKALTKAQLLFKWPVIIKLQSAVTPKIYQQYEKGYNR